MENVAVLDRSERSCKEWSQLLAELGRHSDKAIYIQLFNHFAPKIKGYIIRLGVVEGPADELTQEVMLLLWRKAPMYNPDKAAASTWIYTLARNQTIDWMRKQKYPEYSLDECNYDPVEEGKGESSIVSDRIAKAISDLPESQAQVIYMSFFEGRSHGEIAERLNIPLGSVKSRIRLASEKLKTIWRGGV